MLSYPNSEKMCNNWSHENYWNEKAWNVYWDYFYAISSARINISASREENMKGLRNLTKIYDQNVFKWEKINNEKNFCISPVFWTYK